jgi:TRAP-type transport system periplasmic protein
MRKLSVLTLIAVLVLGVGMLFVACDQNGEESAEEEVAQESEDQQAETPGGQTRVPANPVSWLEGPERDDQVVIRLGSGSMSPWTSVYAVYSRFFEIVKAETNNGVRVEYFPAAQLGNETDMSQMLQMGGMEMTQPAVNNFTALAPEIGFFLLPYMFQSSGELHYVMDEMTDYLNEKLTARGLRILAWEDMGFRHFYYNSDEPIEHPEDLADLKMRVPSNDIMVATYQAWGDDPVPMSWPETFPALQQGVIDGGDNPVDDIVKARLMEPVNRVTRVHYMPLVHPLLISEDFFQSLSPEMQDIFVEAGEQATLYSRWWVEMNNQNMWDIIRNEGLTVTDVKDEERWAEMARTVWPDYIDQVGGQEVVDRVVGLLEEYRARNN